METTDQQACITCGGPFTPMRKSGKPQRHCGAECRRKSVADAQKARTKAARVTTAAACAECGERIVNAELGRPRRFCSREHAARFHNRRHRRAWLPLRDPSPGQRACAHCGDTFTPKRRDRIYCYGKHCPQSAYHARVAKGDALRVVARVANCDGCGSEFHAKHPSARWCSKTCANRHWGNVRARQRGQLSEARYTDLEIFERDGWRCHLCRKLVNRDVPRLHLDGATIDHLIPTSLGGVDEPSNVATAHWKCNRGKRAKAMGEQLALI